MAGANQTWTTADAAQQLNMSGSLSGSGNITKTGPGKVILSAATAGYAGNYAANGGVTELTSVAATPGAGAPVSIGSGGTFYYNNGTAGTVSNNLTLNGGTLSAGGNTQTYSGTVNVSADSTILMRDLANATTSATVRNITLSGTVSGSSKITLDSNDTLGGGNQITGTFAVNRAASTWNGTLALNRGTAVFTNVAGGGNLTPYVGFDGPINFDAFGRVIYRNVDGATLTRTAAISYAARAVGEFQVDNLGALASNFTITQSGAVNFNAGSIVRLNVADAASNLILTGGVVLNGNASVTATGGDADSLVSINTTGISGTGNLAINDEEGGWDVASSRLAINVASTFTGNTTLNEGFLILGHKDALSSGSLTTTGFSTLQASVDLSAGGVGPVLNALTLSTGSLTISGTNNITFNGSLTNNAGNRTLTNNVTSPANVSLAGDVYLSEITSTGRTLTISGTGDTEISGAIANFNGGPGTAGVLTKSGGGILTLSNTAGKIGGTTGNTYSGSTVINEGILRSTQDNVLPNTGTITVRSNNPLNPIATLNLNGNNDTIAALTFGGTGCLASSVNSVTTGAGTLILGGNVNVTAIGDFTTAPVISGNLDLGSTSRTFAISDSTGSDVDLNVQAVISGGATQTLTKTGLGTLMFSAANTYTGATTASAGTLTVNKSLSSGNAVTVASGATLNGTGTIAGTTTIDGIHAPGTSPGIQTVSGNLTYGSSSTLQWELTTNDASTAVRGTNFDGINGGGSALDITTGATSSLVFNGTGSTVNWNNAAWLNDQTWNVFTSYTGTDIFGIATAGADSAAASFGSGNTGNGSFAWIRSGSSLNLQYTAVPEPSSIFAALGLAMCGGWYARRRMKKGASSGIKAKNDDELNV